MMLNHVSDGQHQRAHEELGGETQTMNEGVETATGHEEPMYVNAKQYNRILKRRDARARWEQTTRNVRKEKGYIHESRHRHAMKRPRGAGGRFLSVAELAALDAQGQAKDDLSIVSALSNHVLNNTHPMLQGYNAFDNGYKYQ